MEDQGTFGLHVHTASITSQTTHTTHTWSNATETIYLNDYPTLLHKRWHSVDKNWTFELESVQQGYVMGVARSISHPNIVYEQYPINVAALQEYYRPTLKLRFKL